MLGKQCKGYLLTKHVILNISFERDWLQCICGWEGKAYDLKDYFGHRKIAPPIDKEYILPFAGKFNTRYAKIEDY